MIEYIKGDLFKSLPPNKNIVIPHVCNNIGKFGSGFAVSLKNHYPRSMAAYINRFNKGMLKDGEGHMVPQANNPYLGIFNMVAQDGIVSETNVKPIRYEWLVNCMVQCSTYILDTPDNVEIHAPKFGSDRAGGKWEFIEALIEEIWCGRGISVTVHEL